MTVLGFLAKLKRGLGLAFDANFLHGFSVKMFLFLDRPLKQWMTREKEGKTKLQKN